MKIVGWDRMAAWRDQRMGEEGDLWHRAIIDPVVLELVGPVRGLRVLDLACGNGYLTRRWAREGAVASVGVDLSATTLRYARAREARRPTGARFLRRSAGDLRGLSERSFDRVVANMALLDIADASAAVREAARVLRPDGRFVFSLCHPCFDLDEHSAWVVERVREPDGFWHNVVWRKVRDYRTERSVRVPWKISERTTGWTVSYHRTLSTYSRYLRDAGLLIRRIEEPSPLAEAVRDSPQGPFMLEIPLHLVVEAVPGPVGGAVPTERGSRRRARTPGTAARRSGSRGRTRGRRSAR